MRAAANERPTSDHAAFWLSVVGKLWAADAVGECDGVLKRF